MSNTTIGAAAAASALAAKSMQETFRGSTIIVGGIVVALVFINFLMTPKMDSQEPPLLKSRVPWVGHIIQMLSKQNRFHNQEYDLAKKPFVTLQMLWGKVYAVWDGGVVQSILKSQDASFDPFVIEFGQKSANYSNETNEKCKKPGVVSGVVTAIHKGMSAANLRPMNEKALLVIADELNAIEAGPKGLEISNLLDWVKDLIGTATLEALYGNSNPFRKNKSILDDIWYFEDHLFELMVYPFPKYTVSKAWQARERIQALLYPYYTNDTPNKDSSTSGLVKARYNSLKDIGGLTQQEISLLEVVLPFVALTNSGPAFYWMMNRVFARPDVVEQLRAEITPHIIRMTVNGVDTASVDVKTLETACPLLVSCYKEILRIDTEAVGMRRIMQDTTVTDAKGRSYLLRKGIDVQSSAGVIHRNPNVWGDDAKEFRADRFVPPAPGTKMTEVEKARKASYFPFGGGKHLCPGRNFAFAEIVGTTAVLCVGYDVEQTGKLSFADVQRKPATMANALCKPMDDGKGSGARITRREGWKDVVWKFTASM